MMPDPESCYIDPFTAHPTLNIMSNIYTPEGDAYERDPRGIATVPSNTFKRPVSEQRHSLHRNPSSSCLMKFAMKAP